MKFRFKTLEKRHDRRAFDCGEPVLNRYFHELVSQDIKRRMSNCFIALQADIIAGFYTLSSASIPVHSLPDEMTKRLPRYPVLPAIRIGRLAVDQKFQGHGVGSMLLIDAMRRSLRAEAANFTLLVDAKNDRARSFYQHHGFLRLESAPDILFLPLFAAEKLLSDQ